MFDPVAPLMALTAAFVFALNFYVQSKGLKSTDPVTGAFVSVATMAAVFWGASPLFLQSDWLRHPATLYFVLAGLVFPAMGQFLQIRAVSMVGPALTSAAGSLMPVFAAVPAVLFLSEPFGWRLAAGFGLMMAGLAAMALLRGRLARSWPLWALLLPVGASAARGFAQPLIKTGFRDLPNPFFATLVMASVSSLVLLVIALRSGGGQRLRHPGGGAGWFMLTGVLNGFGILMVNMAVERSDITRVAPFVSTVPLWTLLLGYAVFRAETLDRRHLLVALMVVAGSVLVLTR